MIKNLIFVGYPGSGKGTVAKLLPEYNQISTGDLLRQEIASGSALGKEIDALISKGNLVSDEMALNLIKNNTSPEKNYIFDGYPRTFNQAVMLDSILGEFLAVEFDISKTVLEERIIYRRSCPACGSIYNLKLKVPKVADTCDQCGKVGLFHRKDDTKEVIGKRFAIYEKEADSILNFYRQKKALLTVDSLNTAPDDIVRLIKARMTAMECARERNQRS